MTNKQAFKILAAEMDRRDAEMQKVKEVYIQTGVKLPGYEIGFAENWKSWRQMPKIVKKIKMAARKASKAKGLEVLDNEA
jgi:hypothetical protein